MVPVYIYQVLCPLRLWYDRLACRLKLTAHLFHQERLILASRTHISPCRKEIKEEARGPSFLSPCLPRPLSLSSFSFFSYTPTPRPPNPPPPAHFFFLPHVFFSFTCSPPNHLLSLLLTDACCVFPNMHTHAHTRSSLLSHLPLYILLVNLLHLSLV